MTYNYSNTSKETTLSGPVGPTDTSITIGDTTGLPPSFPYTLVLDYEGPSVEVVSVTNLVGSTLTVTRGEDGTSAQSHPAGVRVVHAAVRRDFVNMAVHIDSSTGVHGIGGGSSVVGTATTQTLTNKTISGASNTLTNIPGTAITSLPASKVVQPFDRLTAVGVDGTTTALDVLGDEGSRTANIARIGKTTGEGLLVGSGGLVTASKAGLLVADGDLEVKASSTSKFKVANATGNTTVAGTVTAAGKLTVTAGGADVTGPVTVTGASTLTGNVGVTGTVTATGNVKAPDFTIAGSPDRSVKAELDALNAALPNIKVVRIGVNYALTSTSYTLLPAGTSVSFTKKFASSNLLVSLETGAFLLSTQPGGVFYAARVSGVDTELTKFTFNVDHAHQTIVGSNVVTGLAAGTYTVAIAGKVSASGNDVRADSSDNFSLIVQEIPA